MEYPVPLGLLVQFITDHLYGMSEALDMQLVSIGIKAKTGTHSLNTICRRIASLSAAHEAMKVHNPCREKEVSTLLSKARKAAVKRGQTPRKVKALTRDLLEAIVPMQTSSLIDIRDKALLLFAFGSGGRRRSEVAHARAEHLTSVEGGYVYHMLHSKTDQEGQGLDLPVLGRAGIALEAWLKASGIYEGYIFRSITKGHKIGTSLTDMTVTRIVKRRAELAGLDASMFAAHSLRSGFVTEAGRQGKSLGDTMALSGHKTVRVCLGYYQSGSVVRNPAANLLD